jgi:peptide/nickel transport system permease protein
MAGGAPLRLASLRRSPAATIGAGILLFWALVALFAPLIAPWDPTAIDFAALADRSPSAAHPFGTDATGRDLLSRLIWGARTTYVVVPLSIGSAFVIGGTAGMLAGWYGGWVDIVVSRIGDVMLSFPALVLYIILITSFGPSLLNIVIAVTLAYAPGVARLMRGQVLAVKQRDFVAAARAGGESGPYIMAVEILPNVGGPLVVDLCLRAGYTVILIGTLGFLGLGLPPPTPDWGGMVVEGVNFLAVSPLMTLLPAAAVTSVVVACNLMADGLREAAR